MEITHLRKVKSYVKRQSRMTERQKQALADYWQVYGLEVNHGMLNFSDIFQRDTAVNLEIGFGMGDSLLAMARAIPGEDFIGIEIHRPGIGALFLGLKQHEMRNVRVFQDDATEIIERCIPDNSLTKILLFFPDPWPKHRHHKRRLINTEFAKVLQRKLKKGGILHMATDWEDYATHMLKVIAAIPELSNVAGEAKFSARPDYRSETKFEKRGQRLGHKIWDLIYIKT